MRRFFTVLLMFSLVGLLSSCYFHVSQGNGRVVSEERSVRNFDSVVLEGVGNVTVRPGQSYRGKDYVVVVTTDSNLQDLVAVDVNRNTLYIDQRSHSTFNASLLDIDVYLPDLYSVTLKGAGNINVTSGNTTNFDVTLSGVGNIDARNFAARNVDVRHSGTGDVTIWATHNLSGRLSGVGDIIYRGNPWESIIKTGIGRVRRL